MDSYMRRLLGDTSTSRRKAKIKVKQQLQPKTKDVKKQVVKQPTTAKQFKIDTNAVWKVKGIKSIRILDKIDANSYIAKIDRAFKIYRDDPKKKPTKDIKPKIKQEIIRKALIEPKVEEKVKAIKQKKEQPPIEKTKTKQLEFKGLESIFAPYKSQIREKMLTMKKK